MLTLAAACSVTIWTARDSNRGGRQSCRWDYDLYKLEGSEEAPLFGEEDAPFAMSPKDLKLIESIPQMIEMGIDSLKIEGRMKSIHYVATVVSVYRKVIDAYCADPDNFVIEQEWLDELDKCANRDTAPAFSKVYQERMSKCLAFMGRKRLLILQVSFFIMMKKNKLSHCSQGNFFKAGDEVEIFRPRN
ncbi:peptidase U32 family protein [Bacillus sp. SL00103]